MIPLQCLSLKLDIGNEAKDNQRNNFLNNLQLHERKGAAIAFEANSIGRHLTAIFEESDSPREGNHANERPVAACTCLLQFEVTIPGKRHEDVACKQE